MRVRFPTGLLSRWFLVIFLILGLLIVYFTFHRSTVIDIAYSYGALWPDSENPSTKGDVLIKKSTNAPKPSILNRLFGNPGTKKPDQPDQSQMDGVKSYAELNCPRWDDRMINVHFILHTHDDPGWLKTPEEYYEQDVYHILHAVIQQLIMEPQRKFVYSELYFFSKWWKQLDAHTKRIVKKLIQNGQLEFVGGGWVQNDDATTHYTGAIDQLTYGWAKIDDYFGEHALPKTGWHIDCFGYSQEQADIFHQMGLDYDVIDRLHHKDMIRRRQNKEMEFMWQTSIQNNLFTHLLYDHYTAPAEFQYETDRDEVFTAANRGKKIRKFFDVVKQRSQAYRTNHLLVIMGSDFTYKNASVWFNPIDELIRYGNLQQLNQSKIQLFYSTPSCYFKGVQESASSKQNLSWPRHDSDFFPYATSPYNYWTGFYSSRASLKRVIRVASNLLLTAQNLAATYSNSQIEQLLNSSREALYTTFHHDGITGTCKQEVANEYIRLALKSIQHSQETLDLILNQITKTEELEFCPLLNISICPITQNSDEVTIVVFNGFSHERSSFIRVPIKDQSAIYELLDGDGNIVPFQILPITDEIKQFWSDGRAEVELGFFASLPALGMANFRLKKGAKTSRMGTTKRDGHIANASIENEFFKLDFDENGQLSSIEDKENGNIQHRLKQNFHWYAAPNSGAYMFRPEGLRNISGQKIIVERIEKGPLVEEIRQTFAPYVTQIVRLYKEKPYVEFEWSVGPLPQDFVAREVITRFTTNIQSNGTFYTDANGRRLVKRKRDPMDSNHPIAASYYPATAVTALRDDKWQLSLLIDRSMGASSVLDGSLEVMIYRKVIHDDGAGMGEGLMEFDDRNRSIVVRGKIRLILSSANQADQLWPRLAKEMFYEPVVAFSTNATAQQWPNKISTLSKPMPQPIHVLTLRRWAKDVCLVRFEYFQIDDKESSIVLGNFKEYFRGLDLDQCNRTQLSGWNRNRSYMNSQDMIMRSLDILTFKCVCSPKNS